MLETFDNHLLRILYDATSSPEATAAMRMLSFVGSGWIMVFGVPFLAVRRFRPHLARLYVTVAVVAVVVFLLKAGIGRPRPYVCLPTIVPREFAPTDPSLPSGHAAGSFAVAAHWAAKKVGIRTQGILFAMAWCVALSRICLGVHFPTDVAAGALLGGLLGFVISRSMLSTT